MLLTLLKLSNAQPRYLKAELHPESFLTFCSILIARIATRFVFLKMEPFKLAKIQSAEIY